MTTQRALVERAIEGGYQFLVALIGVDACSAMNRAMEHFEVLKVNSKEKFFGHAYRHAASR